MHYSLSGHQTDTMLDAYVTCALWSTTHGDEDTPLECDFDADDLHPDTLAAMRADVENFLNLLDAADVPQDAETPEQMGHDLWLTRNGHGAGFWDRGLGKVGDDLTTWADSMGMCDLYPGDDGKLYVA